MSYHDKGQRPPKAARPKTKVKEMRKTVLQLMALALLLSACTLKDLDYPKAPYYSNGMPTNAEWFGTFDIEWTVDRQVVDTATLYADPQFWVSHFPTDYISQVLLDNGLQTVATAAPDYNLGYTCTGYSDNAVYFSVVSDRFSYPAATAGGNCTVRLHFAPGMAVAMYDRSTDAWAGVFPIDSIAVTDPATARRTLKVVAFDPQLTLAFHSTKRKK